MKESSPKTLIEKFKGFEIFRSTDSEDPEKKAQLFIVDSAINGDVFRVNLGIEGCFEATWKSQVELPEFLIAAERYFQEFEPKFTEDTDGIMVVITSCKDLRLYEFNRPVTMEILAKDGVFIRNNEHLMELLRLDTSSGDICYEPKHERIGIIAYLDQGVEKPTINALARLVTRTQVFLPEDVVARAMKLLL